MKCKICGKHFGGDTDHLSTCTSCYHEYHESKEELMGEEPEGDDGDED